MGVCVAVFVMEGGGEGRGCRKGGTGADWKV